MQVVGGFPGAQMYQDVFTIVHTCVESKTCSGWKDLESPLSTLEVGSGTWWGCSFNQDSAKLYSFLEIKPAGYSNIYIFLCSEHLSIPWPFKEKTGVFFKETSQHENWQRSWRFWKVIKPIVVKLFFGGKDDIACLGGGNCKCIYIYII